MLKYTVSALALSIASLIVVSCSGQNSSVNNGGSVETAQVNVFDAQRLQSYTLEELEDFAQSGMSEADLKRCDRALSGSLEVTDAQWIVWCTQAAYEGQTYAYLPLAEAYENGTRGTVDLKQAVEYYQMAADAGEAAAYPPLINLYFDGEGVANYEKAQDVSQKALLVNQSEGALIIAKMAYNGLGDDPSITKCFAYSKLGNNMFLATHNMQEGDYNETFSELKFMLDLCSKELRDQKAANALYHDLSSKYHLN